MAATPFQRLFRISATSLLTLVWLLYSARGQGFTDVTALAGINHVQSTEELLDGLSGTTFLTGGAAAGDFDGDGLIDLVFTRMNDTDILYRNLGNGTFEPRTTAAGFDMPTLTNGIVSGDIDNDGDLDLYMTTTGDKRNFLYLNDGNGFFTDAGTDNVATLANDSRRFGQGASFGDFDNDGYLDLMTGDWGSLTHHSQSQLLRNLGATNPGRFEDVTVAAGLDEFRDARSYRFAPRFVDLDRDGHLDLTFAADFVTSQLFWNNGDGTFTDGTIEAGVGTDRNGMGTTFADYDGDGDLDWFITNITEPPDVVTPFGGWNRLYRNEGDRTFTDVTQQAGVRDSGWSWGTSFFDYDNDGDKDLIATNGYNGEGWLDDQTVLWRNDDGVFTNVSDALGITDTDQGRGLLHFDYDNDGDLDVVIVNNEAAPVLYRNDINNGNHYLRIDLEGNAANREGIGTWITVTPDLSQPEIRQVWEVDGGSSFLSQNERTAHFGLGDRDEPVDMITLEWSGGLVQHLFNVAVDQTLLVQQTDQWMLADFNADGMVDAGDYTWWRNNYGSNSTADISGDGLIGQEEYFVWRTHLGRGGPSASIQAVPEPASWLGLFLTTSLLVAATRLKAMS